MNKANEKSMTTTKVGGFSATEVYETLHYDHDLVVKEFLTKARQIQVAEAGSVSTQRISSCIPLSCRWMRSAARHRNNLKIASTISSMKLFQFRVSDPVRTLREL